MSLLTTTPDQQSNRPVRVLVVDDSALVRKLLKHILEEHRDIEVIDTAIDAKDARAKIKALNPDVITLDIEMPGMSGLEFLEKIMTLRPMPVVVVSTLTQRGATTTLDALRLGAVDCVGKPQQDLGRSLGLYKDELHHKVLTAAKANVAAMASKVALQVSGPRVLDYHQSGVSDDSALQPILAIGASTGGTEAINQVLEAMPANAPAAVVTQHIPESFAESFAERVNSNSAMSVAIAKDGDRILPGHAYVAPGDQHLEFKVQGPNLVCKLSNADPVNRHRPAVDVMFDSLAKTSKNKTVAVLLTGMGKDGAAGMLRLKEQGARTLVQDEASSVVWGMPGAAAKLGAAEEELPLNKVAVRLLELAKSV